MKHLLKLSFVFLLFSITTRGQEQLFKNNIRQYKTKIAVKADKLIEEIGNTISADSIDPTFKPNGYDPIAINLQPMRKKKLNPSKIYEQVSAATVIVSSAGKCGEKNEKGGLVV